jgi:hypothetical protein
MSTFHKIKFKIINIARIKVSVLIFNNLQIILNMHKLPKCVGKDDRFELRVLKYLNVALAKKTGIR